MSDTGTTEAPGRGMKPHGGCWNADTDLVTWAAGIDALPPGPPNPGYQSVDSAAYRLLFFS